MKLSNKGFIKYNSSEVGDMYLIINVKILDIKDGKHLAMLKQINDEINSKKTGGFW